MLRLSIGFCKEFRVGSYTCDAANHCTALLLDVLSSEPPPERLLRRSMEVGMSRPSSPLRNAKELGSLHAGGEGIGLITPAWRTSKLT